MVISQQRREKGSTCWEIPFVGFGWLELQERWFTLLIYTFVYIETKGVGLQRVEVGHYFASVCLSPLQLIDEDVAA